jgi:ABC-type transporter Mla subunit MlaD
MSTSTNHWKLGLFVLSALALAVGAGAWLGASALQRSSVEAVTFFDESVQGLDIGSPVKFRGVPVGGVTGIGIAPDRRHVEVRAEIYADKLGALGLSGVQYGDDRPMLNPSARSPEVRVELASAGITGVKFVQLDFFDPDTDPPPALPFDPPPNYFPSRPSTLKTLEAALAELTQELPVLLNEAGEAMRVTSRTLDSVQLTLAPLASPQGPIFATLEEFRGAAAAIQSGLSDVNLGSTAAAVRSAAGSVGLAANSVGSASQSLGALYVDVAGLAEDMRADLAALGETLEAVRALADYLERDPGALLRGRGDVGEPAQ